MASVQYALKQVDSAQPPDPETIILEVGKPLETILQELHYPADPASTRRFVDSYRGYFAEHYSQHTRPYPGAKQILERLRSVGARLALVTTKHQSQAELVAQGAGLAGYFDYIHGWLEGRQHKPDPEPVVTAMRQLGVEPHQSLMVGDSEQDILAAKAAGVASCAVTYGFRPALFLKSLHPDFLISRLTDLIPIVVFDDCGD